MFERLRSAFSGVAKSIGERELGQKEIDRVLSDLEVPLLESDVAIEVVDAMRADLGGRLAGTSVERKHTEKFIQDSLVGFVSRLFDDAGEENLVENIRAKKGTGEPYVVVFVGINGTGKTTSLAKIASMLQGSKISMVVAAADTYRAGAIEQLREHTNHLNLKLVAQNYGADPAAVARDALLYARSHKIDCVLVDTAGRMQTSKNLMEQISKITSVVKPDFKIFVGDSLAGNNTVSQARQFYEHVKFDGSILTKADADAKGGAALSIVMLTSTPIMYVGVGQAYGDLRPFSKDEFIRAVFGRTPDAGNAENAAAGVRAPAAEADMLDVDNPKAADADDPAKAAADVHVPVAEAANILDADNPKAVDADDPKAAADPFEGLDTGDISQYASLYGLRQPEDDEQARVMAPKIKEWVRQGRPGAPKKRRSLFGGLGRHG